MDKKLKDRVSPYAYEKYLKKYDPDWEPNRKARKQARSEARLRWWKEFGLPILAIVISSMIGIAGIALSRTP